jgi:hypothetical protein
VLAQGSASIKGELIAGHQLPSQGLWLFRGVHSSWPDLLLPSVALFLAELLR